MNGERNASWDFIVVGGGPAGLATAIFAARAGLSAIVIDRSRLPVDKACGEGIMPAGVALLEKMGVAIETYASFPGIRYVDGGVTAQARFPERPGWGVRRPVLIRAMLERARALGVEIRDRRDVNRWRCGSATVQVEVGDELLEGRYLVGADGLHSKLRKQAGLESPARGRQRFGVRRHFRRTPWSSFVEVHWADTAEAYLTPVGAKELGVAFLCEGSVSGFDELMNRFPALASRLARATPVSPVRGGGPFPQRARRRYRDRLVLVGDAAGYVDALTGEGLSLAFQCAHALVRIVKEGRPLADYDTAYQALSRAYYATTGALLAIARRPRIRRRLVATLARKPELFDSLLAVSMGRRPLRSIGVLGVLGVLEGLAVSQQRR